MITSVVSVHHHPSIESGREGRVRGVQLTVDNIHKGVVVRHAATECEDGGGVGLGDDGPGPRLTPVDVPGSTAPHDDPLQCWGLLTTGRVQQWPRVAAVLWWHRHWHIGHCNTVQVCTIHITLAQPAYM